MKWSKSVPMSFRQPPRLEGGFTLVEVLLAVSLVAMMAALVFGSLFVTTSAIDAARANSANEQIIRSTLRVMIDELSVGKNSQTSPWMGINGQFDGQPADTIAFLTMGQFRGAESTKDTEEVRIVYTREGDRLLRYVRKNLYGLTDESVGQIELVTKVKAFNVRYYDEKNRLWVDEWDGRGRLKSVPKALLIELTLLQENAELQTIRQWVTVGAS
jgi:general secretion pathway protein J